MVYGFDDNLNKIEVKDKATQEAKDSAQDSKISALESGKADTGHTHSEYATKTELAGKSDSDHTHSEYATKDDLSGKANSSHTHDDRYYTETEVNNLLVKKSDTTHTHSDYATKTELSGKSDSGHNHDDRYYTESEINSKLAGKSDTSHTHDTYLPKSGNQTFSGELRVTREDANVPMFVRAPNEENVWLGLTNSTGTGYFGVNADKKPMFMGYETEEIALMSDVPDENTLLKRTGGTMNGEIRFNGGNTQGGSKIVLENGKGQITNSTTGTLFGFLNNTDIACGEATYNLLMRGLASRPTYNGSNVALQSDIPPVDSALSSSSTNPLQNKVVNNAIYNLGVQIRAEIPNITISTSDPSGGSHGDIWLKYE